MDEPDQADPNFLQADDLAELGRTYDALLHCYDKARRMLDSDTRILSELKSIEQRYDRIEPLSLGGMKVIFKVRDMRSGRFVAMARLRRKGDLQQTENFLREARITAHLEHPNIVPIYDMGLSREGDAYFTMKLLSGQWLHRIIERIDHGEAQAEAEFPRERLLEIFLRICDAVAFAHSEGVIHLDLKPENIHISDFGEVLVCDWGLAHINEKVLERDDDILDDQTLVESFVQATTIHGSIKGTPGFMAPEQVPVRHLIRGRRHRPRDQRTDIYSLGALLYNLITCRLPIDETDPNVIMSRTRSGELIPPQQRRPDRDIHPGLAAVAMKAMALVPEERYQTVADMQAEVSSFLAGYATEAEHASSLTQLRRLAARHHRTLVLAALMTLTLLAVIGTYSYVLLTNERATRFAEDQIREVQLSAMAHETRYRDEHQRLTRIEQSPSLYYEAVEHWKAGALDQAAHAINLATTWNPNLLLGWELKGDVHFARHEFNLAIRAWSHLRQPELKFWLEKAQRFREFPRRHQRIAANYLAPLLEELGEQRLHPRTQRLVDHLLAADLTQTERLNLLQTVLSFDNPDANLSNMHLVRDGDRISLGLNNSGPFHTLRLLRGLDLRRLELEHSQLSQLDDLRFCQIDELNLAHNPDITCITALDHMNLHQLCLAYCGPVSLADCTLPRLHLLDLRGTTCSPSDLHAFFTRHPTLRTLLVTANDTAPDPTSLPKDLLLLRIAE